MSLFDQDYEAPKRERVPTLNQYLKTLGKKTKVLDQVFQVEIVWMPGKFNNLTLQTHAFRLILNEDHVLFTSLQETFADNQLRKELGSFGISITDRETKSFKLEQQPTKQGQWSTLGETAWKFSN